MLREPLAVLGVAARAAAGGDDHVLELRERRDHFALALAEAGLAFLLEDVGDVDAGAPLDLDVAVVEVRSSRRASCLPTAVLPEPIGPIRKTFRWPSMA